MALTEEDVRHIAKLARLALSDEEIASYKEQLSSILEYVEQLNEIDTSGIPPTFSVLLPDGALRADQPHPGLGAEDLEKNAPDWDAGQFKVPLVLD